jgi:hypothetical protein
MGWLDNHMVARNDFFSCASFHHPFPELALGAMLSRPLGGWVKGEDSQGPRKHDIPDETGLLPSIFAGAYALFARASQEARPGPIGRAVN